MKADIRSRTRLAQVAYQVLAHEHAIYRPYIVSAIGAALAVLKAHRRRLRKGHASSPPYVHKPFLVAENQSYWLDRDSGRIRIPIRGTAGVQLFLPLSVWHRSYLNDRSWELGSITVVPGKIIIAVCKVRPAMFEPSSAIALDTNERTLDGVLAANKTAELVTIGLGGVQEVQTTHFRRRRRLAERKSHDRRVGKNLIRREGRREHNRVMQRLHRVSKALVTAAAGSKAAIVLEHLTLHGAGGRSHRMSRRLSSWPRGELHRQIEYKAALAGVPVIKVNPAWTSKTCPVCGARRRDRVGQDFVCSVCDWEMDRQHNPACNILLSALASNETLARAVRFRPGALRDDVVSPRYDPLRGGGSAREEPSGAESQATFSA